MKKTSKASHTNSKTIDYYESDPAIRGLVHMHLGFPSKSMLDLIPLESTAYFSTLTRTIKDVATNKTSLLDLGCGIGRLTLELSSFFEKSIGIDLSLRLVDLANNIRDNGWSVLHQFADIDSSIWKSKLLVEFDPGKVIFLRDDVLTYLKKAIEKEQLFSCVCLLNLICRVENPKYLLKKAMKVVENKGLLVVSTPYTFPCDSKYNNMTEEEIEQDLFLFLDKDECFKIVTIAEIPFFFPDYGRRFYVVRPKIRIYQKHS